MYLSGLPGTPTATAADTPDRLLMSMKEAEVRLRAMSPADQKEFLQFLLLVHKNLPPTKQQRAEELLRQAESIDPRGVPGLGQFSSLASIAQIAGIVASLGSLGVGAFGAYQGYKDQKAQNAAQSEIASAQAASLRAETAAKQQEIALMQQAAAGAASGAPPLGTKNIMPFVYIGGGLLGLVVIFLMMRKKSA